MLGMLIEHYGGDFPLWLAPEQVRLATVSEEKKIVKFATELAAKMVEAGLRVELDLSNETVGKKIRSAELMKVPYTLVIGEKEVKSGKLTARVRKGEGEELPAEGLISRLRAEVQERQ
jgi:threonyl-tRNA synthetase